ncbi:N2227-domain-containing protein [Patellaria atrata CBS 101060]|uniref:N2227-domain-containing protein n=1 Tax=Patellaria atrata CBS 101060 TaxID=1346257 RepID=A0A9P4S3B0_9PEZI|nr:N2227-domain-containing protein [Patellaria atrata CBS 101060]
MPVLSCIFCLPYNSMRVFLLILWCWVCSSSSSSTYKNLALASSHNSVDSFLSDAKPVTVVVTRITVLTAQDLITPDQSERHRKEKKRLLEQLNKNDKSSRNSRNRLLKALHGFSRCGERNLAELKRWKSHYGHVPRHQKKVLEQAVRYSEKLNINEQLIWKNHQLCEEIVRAALDFYDITSNELEGFIHESEAKSEPADRISVSQALKHYVRDWSGEGAHERKTFSCILNTLAVYAPPLEQRISNPLRVLIPGAGLGRLGFNITALDGYEVTTNEWSMFMNVAYRFLESRPNAGQHVFYPFIDSWSHHATTADLQRNVTFPDQRLDTSSVLLVEGDFTTAFQGSRDSFDFIVTHFFIDTARNLMSYLETIHTTLRKGGYWINSGPLLYGSGPWVQLSLDEIIAVSEHLGFEFLEMGPTCGESTFPGKKVRWIAGIYGSNERALNINGYRVQSWVARKK